MNEPNQDNDQHITCQCCHSQIPLSAALTSEGMDYAYHFCGVNCFEKWKKQQEKDSTK